MSGKQITVDSCNWFWVPPHLSWTGLRREQVKCVRGWPMVPTDSGYLIRRHWFAIVIFGYGYRATLVCGSRRHYRQEFAVQIPCTYSNCLPIRRANVPQIAGFECCRSSRLASTLSIEADLVPSGSIERWRVSARCTHLAHSETLDQKGVLLICGCQRYRKHMLQQACDKHPQMGVTINQY